MRIRIEQFCKSGALLLALLSFASEIQAQPNNPVTLGGVTMTDFAVRLKFTTRLAHAFHSVRQNPFLESSGTDTNLFAIELTNKRTLDDTILVTRIGDTIRLSDHPSDVSEIGWSCVLIYDSLNSEFSRFTWTEVRPYETNDATFGPLGDMLEVRLSIEHVPIEVANSRIALAPTEPGVLLGKVTAFSYLEGTRLRMSGAGINEDFFNAIGILEPIEFEIANTKSTVSRRSLSNFGVEIYPSPASSMLHITSKDGLQGSMVVSDAAGRTVRGLTVNASDLTLDISDLPCGPYHLTLNSKPIGKMLISR